MPFLGLSTSVLCRPPNKAAMLREVLCCSRYFFFPARFNVLQRGTFSLTTARSVILDDDRYSYSTCTVLVRGTRYGTRYGTSTVCIIYSHGTVQYS